MLILKTKTKNKKRKGKGKREAKIIDMKNDLIVSFEYIGQRQGVFALV